MSVCVCEQERHFLGVSNYVFTVIFTLEMIVKVFVCFFPTTVSSDTYMPFIHVTESTAQT